MSIYKDKPFKYSSDKCLNFIRNTKSSADLPPEICHSKHEGSIKEQAPKENFNFIDSFIREFLDVGIDSDKLLIAVLLYMLIKEGADIKLIIALGYILI